MNPSVTPLEHAVYALRALFGSRGYALFCMSRFEAYDLYMQNKSFLVSDQVITFTDGDGRLMALKPDVTLSIVRNTKDVPGSLRKVWYDENVYRAAPGSRDFREIRQLGLECLGALDAYCLSEVLSLAADSLAALSPDAVLCVSHLGILSAVLDSLGVSAAGRQSLLACVREKNRHDAALVCAGEGVSAEKTDLLMRLLSSEGLPDDVMPRLFALTDGTDARPYADELAAILAALPAGRVRVDFSILNDMNYYNGIVFQGFIRGIPNEVLSGGQYDLLMKRMGKNAGAAGFAVYLDQLAALFPHSAGSDADVLLLYGSDAAPADVAAAVRRLTADGQRVCAMRSVPAGFCAGRICRLIEGEVVDCAAE